MIELADKWTRQPQRLTGAAGVGWDLLWSAAAPLVNQATGKTVAPVVPTRPGAAGQWADYQSTSAAQSFPVPSASSYTLYVVLAHPAASTGSAGRILSNGSVGVRLEGYTTGGGVYLNTTHTGVAGGVSFVTGVGSFDTKPWTYVITYDGTTQRGWLRDSSGLISEASPATIGISTPSQVDFGYVGGASCGLYAAGWRRGALNPSAARRLLANPWGEFSKRPKRIFVSAGGGATESTISAASGVSTASALAGSSVASTTVASASGASTTSTIAGASTAVATASAAGGVSTAQTLAGASVTVAAISAASGATTAATITASSTAETTVSAASGAATASTLTSASTAVSALSAASGSSTASTLTGVAGSGSTIGVAAGVSTSETITASSVAVSTISAASGASSDQIIVGAAFAEAAISGASGVSTCSTLTGSNAAGLASIEVAAGISSAQIIVGSSFAASAIAAATGVATCSTMMGLGGADAEEAYPLRGTTPSYPLSGLESSALTDPQTYPLQGLTQE